MPLHPAQVVVASGEAPTKGARNKYLDSCVELLRARDISARIVGIEEVAPEDVPSWAKLRGIEPAFVVVSEADAERLRQMAPQIAWPEGLDEFGAFLQRQGLWFQRRGVAPGSGDVIWQYGTNAIAVRWVSGHDMGGICVADIAGWPQQWYGAAQLRDLLKGEIDDNWPHSEGDDGVSEQMKFVEEYWQAIVKSFSDGKRSETHEALKTQQLERGKRYRR